MANELAASFPGVAVDDAAEMPDRPTCCCTCARRAGQTIARGAGQASAGGAAANRHGPRERHGARRRPVFTFFRDAAAGIGLILVHNSPQERAYPRPPHHRSSSRPASTATSPSPAFRGCTVRRGQHLASTRTHTPHGPCKVARCQAAPSPSGTIHRCRSLCWRRRLAQSSGHKILCRSAAVCRQCCPARP